MLKIFIFSLSLCLAPLSLFAQHNSPYNSANQEIAKAIKNKKKFLKIPIVRIEKNIFEKQDATHIDYNGKVYYYVGIDFLEKTTRWDSADEFVNEFRTRNREYTISHWSASTAVIVHDVDLFERDVNIGITNPAGNKSAIHFNFEKSNYSPFEIIKLIRIAFADSLTELTSKSIKLDLGMSIDEVIKLKGQPKTRAELGEKTVLTYDDVKIIFQEGKLSDVQ